MVDYTNQQLKLFISLIKRLDKPNFNLVAQVGRMREIKPDVQGYVILAIVKDLLKYLPSCLLSTIFPIARCGVLT